MVNHHRNATYTQIHHVGKNSIDYYNALINQSSYTLIIPLNSNSVNSVFEYVLYELTNNENEFDYNNHIHEINAILYTHTTHIDKFLVSKLYFCTRQQKHYVMIYLQQLFSVNEFIYPGVINFINEIKKVKIYPFTYHRGPKPIMTIESIRARNIKDILDE